MNKLIIVFFCFICSGISVILINFLLNKNRIKKYIINHCQRYFVSFKKKTISLSPFHPNNICYFRTILAWVSMWLYGLGLEIIGINLYIISSLMDALDGMVARKCNLVSSWGETLDPICDKLSYLAPLWYFASIGYIPVKIFYIFVFLEIPGQIFARSVLASLQKSVAANNFGKIKAVLCFCLIPYCFILDYNESHFINFAPQIMKACVALSFLSFAFKLIPNKYYANILSLMNLLCGLVGCYLAVRGYFLISVLLVMAGQVFDLFDGRMAEKHGSTTLGPWIDDLADFVSFGLCPGIIMISRFYEHYFVIFVALVYVFAIIYRLLRFVLVDKKNKNLVHIFSGLPSPAAAAITMGLAIIISNFYLFSILIFIVSILSVSTIRFSHLGYVILKNIPRPLIIITGASMCLLTVWIVKYNCLELLGYLLIFCSLVYIILGKLKY